MKYHFFLIVAIAMTVSACISNDYVDDRVDPVLRIANAVDSIAIDSTYQFKAIYLNNVGLEEEINADWFSSDENIISITSDGLASALSPGSSEISVEYKDSEVTLLESNIVGVGERTVESEIGGKGGSVKTTSTYKLEGDFTLSEADSGELILAFGEDYEASTALPGLFIYLSNNPSTTSGALELQAVEVFKGAHSYSIPGVELNDYKYVLYFCKPFNVKVGHGEIEDL